ncbi:MAG: PHP domain-containing protein [Clostridia bacterium]|nr:PHP domain-containing protein [Clostridia bacterium]
MYKYETHLHTYPVSKCARKTVAETLDFYKEKGYDGVFLTNHFVCGNINIDSETAYKEKLDFYFSDYHEAVKHGEKIGLKVFLGVELSYKGTDFLIYGLSEEWYYNHPEIENMKKSEELQLLMDAGAFVVHAHPMREAKYIDHIRLFPRLVHGVEVINGCRTDFENKMADQYADNYELFKQAGTDNHFNGAVRFLASVKTKTPVTSVEDYISKVRNGETEIFTEECE